ncbi:hypothetical protein CEUSTIGMA_g10377.t1 [Chlamydomonas eustigma]|uniref:EamA domain-containing protein n=1 Tax=Chlamydomonas eustigma TaxID=1157962 RepID=A0A250XJH0_9CHLO|nr:hypothetical protein CEUSTIGMA_g10377.t1 [Chlamydomonas eustigma]|eukprot:GAX82950.1 hypothetical protein CEUSTIGMA_g10377.t1 [Chlamydomonas eustigma]
MIWTGIAFALSAAVANSCIDSVRKYTSTYLQSISLVALPALIEAFLACILIYSFGGLNTLTQDLASLHSPWQFIALTLVSSSVQLYSKFLYQRALSLAPLSLTVPYLSCTPAILIAIAYIFLGEQPSGTGLVGVVIITLGGYLLSVQTTISPHSSSSEPRDEEHGDNNLKKTQKSTPWPFNRLIHHNTTSGSATDMNADNTATSLLCVNSVKAAALIKPFPRNISSNSLPHDFDASQTPNPDPCTSISTARKGKGGGGNLSARDTMLRNGSGLDWVPVQAGKIRQQQQQHQQVGQMPPVPLTMHSQMRSSFGGVPSVSSSLVTTAAAAAAAVDKQLTSASISDVKSNSSMFVGGTSVGGVTSLQSSSLCLAWYQPIRMLAQQPGSLMMVGVAALWSITASLDKMGVLMSPSIWIYIAFQRICIATLSCCMLLSTSPASFSYLKSQPSSLLLISTLELLSMILFLEAIKHIFVSYVVAIKRCNILFSVLVGGYFFKENIRSRLPFVFLMMGGMSLIVLEPNSATIHDSHATHA